MMRRIGFFYFVLIIVITAASLGYAEKMSDNTMQSNIENRLLSQNFKERNDAVIYLNSLSDGLNNQVFALIIKLFNIEIEKENEFNIIVSKGATAESLPKKLAYINSEEYGTYHLNLCELAAKSRNRTLLPLLIDHCLNPKSLLIYEDQSVGKLVEIVLNPEASRDRKRAAISVLGEMLKPKKGKYTAIGKIRQTIKDALLKTATSQDSSIRLVSIRALGNSGDKDLIQEIENIGNTDKYYILEKDERKVFPVREEAIKAIRMLRK